jgi:hypothetical protein
MIYSCVYPKDHLQVNVVIRLFITDHGYYAITYKRGLEKLMELMEKEGALKWMEKLKSITLKLLKIITITRVYRKHFKYLLRLIALSSELKY